MVPWRKIQQTSVAIKCAAEGATGAQLNTPQWDKKILHRHVTWRTLSDDLVAVHRQSKRTSSF